KIPRDVFKSPIAMELMLLALHQTGGEGTFLAKFWEGRVRSWFSLEIASFGGDVHFYIWTRKNMRDIVESQLYAQYPDIEVTGVAGYIKNVAFEPNVNDAWGVQYVYTKPDAYPIKTYVDFGLDKDPKEELKHDPLTSVLELLGSIKEGENIW